MAIIAKLEKKYKIQSGFETLRNFVLALPKCLAILLISMDMQACRDQWKMYAYNFLGRYLYA